VEDVTLSVKAVSNSSMTVDTLQDANQGRNFLLAWNAWWKKYKVSLQNPKKNAAQDLLPISDVSRFKFPASTHLVTTGNASEKEDWKRIMQMASKMFKPDGDVVIFCSPPWGVLETNRAPYLTGKAEDVSVYRDVELTPVEIGNFASHAASYTPERTVLVMHLPPLELGRYADILNLNGWEVHRE
jgi:hypothetical protein